MKLKDFLKYINEDVEVIIYVGGHREYVGYAKDAPNFISKDLSIVEDSLYIRYDNHIAMEGAIIDE